jgi:hypothetical protein
MVESVVHELAVIIGSGIRDRYSKKATRILLASTKPDEMWLCQSVRRTANRSPLFVYTQCRRWDRFCDPDMGIIYAITDGTTDSFEQREKMPVVSFLI